MKKLEIRIHPTRPITKQLMVMANSALFVFAPLFLGHYMNSSIFSVMGFFLAIIFLFGYARILSDEVKIFQTKEEAIEYLKKND